MEPVKYHRIGTKFNSLMDSYASIAVESMKYITESNNFQLKSYPSQELFYNKYMTFWGELKQEAIVKLQNSPNQADTDDEKRKKRMFEKLNMLEDYIEPISNEGKIDYLNSLENQLNLLINQKILNFTHLFLAYYSLLYQAFNDIPIKGNFSAFEPEILINNLDEYATYFDTKENFINPQNPASKFLRRYYIIPFISPAGVYGFNTWLYLHFNGICPVGISLKPHLVHNGQFSANPYYTSQHDLGHCKWSSTALTILSVYNRQLYIDITSNQQNYNIRDILIYIILIFFFEHEISDNSHWRISQVLNQSNIDFDQDILSERNGIIANEFKEYLTDNIDIFHENNIFNTNLANTSSVIALARSDDYFYSTLIKYWDGLVIFNKNYST